MDLLAPLLALAGYCAFASRRLLRYLHILQQDDYHSGRFLGWLVRTLSFDKRLSLVLVVLAIAALAVGPAVPQPWWAIAAGAAMAIAALLESDPRKDAKKKLVLTRRAWRILGVAGAFAILAGLAIAVLAPATGWVVAVQAVPFLLVAANGALAPVEAAIQKRIRDAAHARLLETGAEVVAITGSFGKTSVKHIVGHILDLNARTCMTPGSVNTPMGISRVIQEALQPACRYFVVEMGAYGQGSIARLCRLTPPRLGIITAIGEAHYERFKSLDAVARAKFELAEAVFGHPDGRLVVHESVLEQPYARSMVSANRNRTIVCGRSADADLVIASSEQGTGGLTLAVRWRGTEHQLEAPLFGLHHADNIALAFAAAVALGIAPDRAIAALRSVRQISHRLEVKRQADGPTYVDDAYNSNPRGFRAALELLPMLAGPGGRRILVTPGVTELGEKHDTVHRELGSLAARQVDTAIVVRPERIRSFVEGFRQTQGKAQLIEVPAFAEAQKWLRANAKPADVVLLENDLPDLYERTLRL